jgi:hypothetical protein
MRVKSSAWSVLQGFSFLSAARGHEILFPACATGGLVERMNSLIEAGVPRKAQSNYGGRWISAEAHQLVVFVYGRLSVDDALKKRN